MTKKNSNNVVFLIYFLTMFFLFSCGPMDGSSNLSPSVGGGGGNITPPSTPEVTVSANPTSISTNALSIITATVTYAGVPVADGTSVTFAVSDSTYGTLSATSASTSGGKGTASVNFASSSNTGPVTITAYALGYSGSVTVTISGSATSGVTVVANPASVPVGGTSTITARVVDTVGQNVADGTQVTFSLSDVTKGSLSEATAYTSGGYATVIFTANAEGSVTVNASAGGKTGTAVITVSNGTITLSASPSTILINETSTISATIKDGTNNPISGVDVTFSIAGSGSLNTTLATTDINGIATVILTGSASAGTATVNASATGMTSATPLNVNVTNGQLALSANPATILINGTSDITATLTYDGTTPIVGATVDFTTTRGSLTIPAITDANGQTTVRLTAEGASGTITVIATYIPTGVTTSKDIEVQAGTITLTPSTTTLYLSTLNMSTITGTFVDGSVSGYVADGTTVRFEVSSGTATLTGGGATYDTITSGGQASVDVTALSAAAGGISGDIVITASVTDVTLDFTSQTTTLTIAPTTLILADPSPNTINAAAAEKSTITATLIDAQGPIFGATVTFTVSNVSVAYFNTAGTSSVDVTTNGSGVATADLTGASAGTVDVTATSSTGATSNQVSLTVN